MHGREYSRTWATASGFRIVSGSLLRPKKSVSQTFASFAIFV
jgi:hypothetical protein